MFLARTWEKSLISLSCSVRRGQPNKALVLKLFRNFLLRTKHTASYISSLCTCKTGYFKISKETDACWLQAYSSEFRQHITSACIFGLTWQTLNDGIFVLIKRIHRQPVNIARSTAGLSIRCYRSSVRRASAIASRWLDWRRDERGKPLLAKKVPFQMVHGQNTRAPGWPTVMRVLLTDASFVFELVYTEADQALQPIQVAHSFWNPRKVHFENLQLVGHLMVNCARLCPC